MEHGASTTPRAFASLEAFPALREGVAAQLRLQSAACTALLASFQERPRLLHTLEAALGELRGGLITLEGPPGSGVSSLIAALAARHAFPLWMAGAAPDAVAALQAQLVALHRPGLPLGDPAVATDPTVLAGLLAELAAARAGEAPLVLLIDELEPPGQPARPGPLILPTELPPGVRLLLGCAPGAALPFQPATRIRLPEDDPELFAVQLRALAARGCPAAMRSAHAAASAGNLLYGWLALRWLGVRLLEPDGLPVGLDALLGGWWAQLEPKAQRLAALVAAAGESVPLSLAAQLLGVDPEPDLTRWEQLGLVDLLVRPGGSAGQPLLLVRFAHRAIGARVVEVGGELVAEAHDALAVAAAQGGHRAATPATAYLRRQRARHAALAPVATRDELLPTLVSRESLLAHERQEELALALDEARWELRAAADAESEVRLVRAAFYAGVVASRARSLAPEAAAEALLAGVEQGGKEAALRRVLEAVERLPDGHAKAALLRRLGEICYNSRMRSSAMRLLSRALDLEASPATRAWRDSRETLFVALAEAALAQDDVEVALAIAERTEHLERRAMLETQVVRRLLAAGEHGRAQRLARGILHESMGAWARAEVAVELLRAGDARGAMMLEELPLETVAAWAQIELACDEVAHDEAAARARIDALPTQGQRDRGLARLSHALARSGDDGGALAAAEAIVAVDVRVAALIELRLGLEGLVAMLALERATRDIGAVEGDDRAPLVAALAAALAALGRHERALAVTDELPPGEERDRALARVAVALAQRGDTAEARALLERVADDDERAWAFEELARLLAAAGRWDEAVAETARIAAEDQRAKALAELAVERARAGQPRAALAMARAVALPAERARALALLAAPLVADGAAAEALALADEAQTLPGAEARSRFLSAVATALAEQGQPVAAAAVAARIARPAQRARAGAAVALALASLDRAEARVALGQALRAAAVGREETLRALELAAPALAALGGAQLLGAVAAAVDEIDRWG